MDGVNGVSEIPCSLGRTKVRIRRMQKTALTKLRAFNKVDWLSS